MSAICGVFQANGGPVAEELVGAMCNAAAGGPSNAGFWVEGAVGLGQPATNRRGLWVAVDGRIDNRGELAEKLSSAGSPVGLDFLSDAACIVEAYEFWGQEAPSHLLGAFAFAIWDAPKQILFCARDHLGLKPFVYHWDGRRFLFASEMRQIFADRLVDRELNLGYLGELLADSYSGLEETPYLDVKRLPGGHRLMVCRSGLEIRRYWNWHPDSEPASAAPLRENAERFRFLLQESVRATRRVPTGSRCGSFLSGGLDSSAIVSLAASEPGFRPETLPTFTLRFPEADPSYLLAHCDPVDESRYTNALVRFYRLEHHPIEIRRRGPFESALGGPLWHEEGPLISPTLAYFQHALARARQLGVRAMLHGEGGDELFSIGSCCSVIPLLQGDLRRFVEDWQSRRRLRGTPHLKRLEHLLRTLTPEFLKVPYRRIVRRMVPPWIDRRFARRVHLRERAERGFGWDTQLHRSPSYGLLIWMRSNQNALVLETLDRLASSCGLELRLPFLDIRLFRFMAGIPWDQKSWGGIGKILLREAMKGLWPEQISARLQKTEFSSVLRTGIERYASQEVRRAVSNPHPILRQMLDLGVAQRLWRRFSRSARPENALPSFWPVWYIVSLDYWLRKGVTDGR